ncbi:MAG: hypothetical protein GTO76_04305 [Planctomycetales bacterium]|nr:hypothetical protein [Planctomycetales bacterium]NIN77021.1 hypothetical protein [Planctomycetales bacterium]NIP04069.1 hypothetical protein [Planctomycetales bacterium]
MTTRMPVEETSQNRIAGEDFIQRLGSGLRADDPAGRMGPAGPEACWQLQELQAGRKSQ